MKNVNNQKGFGLLEVLISFVVLGLMMIVVNRIQQTNRWQMAYNDSRSLALQKAQRIFDSLQVTGLGSIPDSTSVFDCNEESQSRAFKCKIAAKNLGVIDGHVFSKKVNVEVTWKIFEKEHHVEMNGVVK